MVHHWMNYLRTRVVGKVVPQKGADGAYVDSPWSDISSKFASTFKTHPEWRDSDTTFIRGSCLSTSILALPRSLVLSELQGLCNGLLLEFALHQVK